MGRAVFQDLLAGGSAQGASTITQQFVKNALEAQQPDRPPEVPRGRVRLPPRAPVGQGQDPHPVPEHHLLRRGRLRHRGRRPHLLRRATPAAARAAPTAVRLGARARGGRDAGRDHHLAARPSRRGANPESTRSSAATSCSRRWSSRTESPTEEYEEAAAISAPRAASDIERPRWTRSPPTSPSGCASSSSTSTAPGRAFGGGLDVTPPSTSTCRSPPRGGLQHARRHRADRSVVVIDNETGGVKAMVGGNDFEKEPFNLATNGHRQPGSSFKPFTLITAFENGFGPEHLLRPSRVEIPFESRARGQERRGKRSSRLRSEQLRRHLLRRLGPGDRHDGPLRQLDLRRARLRPARHGPQGPAEGRRDRRADGHRRASFDTNPAMILGGIDPGVTPLEMAYAYSTIARDGLRDRRRAGLEPRARTSPRT